MSFLVDVMHYKPAGVKFPATATYHDSCSGLRELGVFDQPRALLGEVGGLTMKPLEGNDVCCGFGGTFCVKYPAISNAVVSEKAAAIERSGAQVLLGGDLGCLMNMAGKLHRNGSPVRVYHAAEVLAGMADAPSIGEKQRQRMSAAMQTSVISFKARADAALADPTLKLAIDRTTGTAERKRAAALVDFPQFEAARERGKRIKDHVIEHLDHYLLEFERNAIASGAKVHWATSADEASRIVVDLCRQAKAKRVTRVKSMLGEEIGLPHALDAAGFERFETDLAEHIVQLAGDRPSHIVWPSMHRTREQVSVMFKKAHRVPHKDETIEAMVDSARRELRDKFLSADVSISGANFLIADTGATCTVTNEGNAELTTSPPRMHIVTAGIEKLVPSLPHAFALLRLLVRSATGADVTQYTTFHCGPKKPGDLDGPEEFHIVLVDNGRTKMLADAGLRDMLRCLRCGACMNHCVVFRSWAAMPTAAPTPGRWEPCSRRCSTA
jgi:L-lactate dehydrogenase complex protein LldF